MLVSIENLTGSAFADTLGGNAGDNVIDGGAGGDAMTGGAGDDTYVVDDAGDSVSEDAGGGTDTVRSTLAAYTLAAEVEDLVLAAGAVDGTGNGLDNRLTGNAGANVLDGGGGSDAVVLKGPISDHEFALVGANTTVTSAAGGTDTLVGIERAEIGGVSYTMVRGTNAANTGVSAPTGGAGNDLVLGFNGADELHGGGGNDILVGGNQVDSMAGGAGDDTYVVNNGADFVSEAMRGSDGTDTIISSVSRNLNSAAQVEGDVENLVLVGTANLNGTGNGLDNVITGNSGSNILSGGGGQDTLIGNAGDDDLRGGAGNDVLIGGDGNDILNGQGGTDDVAVFDGPAGNYAYGFTGGALTSVTDLVGAGGTDTLSGVEFVRFGDGPALAVTAAGGGIPGGPSIIFGTDDGDTIVGGPGADVIIGGPGDDTLNGSEVGDGDDNTVPGTQDDDLFIWRVGDGFDTVNGGMEAEHGDTFQVVGNEEAEIFRIYTYDEAVARIGFAGSDETEIIVTREVGGVETAIAELTEIEEIVVNGSNVAGNGSSGGDSFEMYGNFDLATNLRPNTITIIGSTGDDVIDITSLQSAHRIVFRSNGGHDTVIGNLRPQDVVELPAGTTLADYAVTVDEESGLVRLVGDTHSMSLPVLSGMPQFKAGAGSTTGAQQDDTSANPGGNDDGLGTDDPTAGGNDPDDDDGAAPQPVAGTSAVGSAATDALVGTAGADTLMALGGDDSVIAGAGDDIVRGDAGDDLLSGEAGRDMLFGGAGNDDVLGGDDADMLYGDDGEDRLFGGTGDDLIDGGDGDDEADGGEGDDVFVSSQGNDVYRGGAGSDTLDMARTSGDATVNLGTGFMMGGSASSTATGSDTLWGVENVVTGAGNDTITASSAVNVIDGGAGNDTYRFLSATDADGDTILGFQPGDRIDLSGIDANAGAAGNQAFTLVSGFTGAGQLSIAHEVREDGEYTVVTGNTSGGDTPEFRLSIKGTPTLSASDFDA